MYILSFNDVYLYSLESYFKFQIAPVTKISAVIKHYATLKYKS